MRTGVCCGFGLAVLAMAAAAGAQDKMDTMKKMDSMKAEQSYTGCIERSPDGKFTLTHAMAAGDKMKKDDGMSSMAKDSMTKDSMAKDSMKDSMMKDATPALPLSSTSVDLGKHVGHKVIVTGANGDTMGGMAAFAVKSIKMVASSCSGSM